MDINFENYEYNGAWYGRERISFNGSFFDIDVQMDSDDENLIPEASKEVLIDFINKLDDYTLRIAESILDYYANRREELGYSVEMNIDYPEVDSAEEILNMITLIGITIPDQDDYDEPAVSLVFNCTWDKENGVGVCLLGENIDDVGFQDIAL